MDFSEIRRRADQVVGDAEDWLRSDWSDNPTARQVTMLRDAAQHLARARGSLAAASATPAERRVGGGAVR